MAVINTTNLPTLPQLNTMLMNQIISVDIPADTRLSDFYPNGLIYYGTQPTLQGQYIATENLGFDLQDNPWDKEEQKSEFTSEVNEFYTPAKRALNVR